MSNIVTHSHGSSKNKNEKGNNSIFVLVISLLIISILFFGLNYFLTKKNKNNSQIVDKVSDIEYTQGNANAKIKIVEYADFECPACSGFSQVFQEVFNNINAKYGSSTMSWTFKYFPLTSIHRNALISSYSVEAAKNQGKFWEMNHILFEKQDEWGQTLDAKSKIEGYARDMGLDMNKFILDRDSDETKKIVGDALVEATKLGLSHTPFAFMNGEEMKDLQLDVKYIQDIIEKKINEIDSLSIKN